MKKNICIFNTKSGVGCNHPDHGVTCSGKCRDFVEDIEDLIVKEKTGVDK